VYDGYFTPNRSRIQIGINIVSAVALVLLFLLPLYSAFNDCRTFFPACTAIGYFFASLVFGTLAVVFFMLAYFSNAMNGEIETYAAGVNPNVISWYALPLCESKLKPKLIDARNAMETVLDQVTDNGCSRINSYCSSQSTYNSAAPNKLFNCAVPSQSCTNNLKSAFVSSSLKSGASDVCNGAASECTMSACATTCSLATQLRTDMEQVDTFVKQQGYVNSALDVYDDTFTCTSLVQIVIDGTKTFLTLESAFWLIGAGCILAQVLLIAGICVLFKGQKLFFKPLGSTGDTEPTK
jgi:hypothetical protein